MNESRYTIMVNDRPAREEVCERRGINAQMARDQPREVKTEPARKEPQHARD